MTNKDWYLLTFESECVALRSCGASAGGQRSCVTSEVVFRASWNEQDQNEFVKNIKILFKLESCTSHLDRVVYGKGFCPDAPLGSIVTITETPAMEDTYLVTDVVQNLC